MENELTKAINFWEKFIRAGGVVSWTEFSEFNEIDQQAFLDAGMLVEKYKALVLEEMLINMTTTDPLTSRIMALSNRINQRKMEQIR